MVVVLRTGVVDQPDDGAFPLAGYCEAAAALEAASLRTGAASSPGIFDGSPDAVVAVAGQAGPATAALRSLAPEPVRDDVASLADALAAAARGDHGAVREPAVAAAARRASQHHRSECGHAGGALDGD